MSDAPVGWGFIGTSGWVAGQFASSVLAAGQDVIGAFGSSPGGSAEFARTYACTAYQSVAEMLADSRIEAVWVASPTVLHVEHARAVYAAGKAVLVEKPIAVDSAGARLLCDSVAPRPNLPAAIAFQHRFNPPVVAVREVVRGGSLGDISSVTIHASVDAPGEPTGWRLDPLQSGGWSVTDIGTHLLDIARDLVGDVEFWAARLSSPGLGLPVDDLSVVVLTAGPATIVVRASTGSSGPPSLIEVSGTQGWVRVSDFMSGGGILSGSAVDTREIEQADPYARQAAAFSASVRGAAWKGATLDDGRRVTEIVDAARAFNAARSAG